MSETTQHAARTRTRVALAGWVPDLPAGLADALDRLPGEEVEVQITARLTGYVRVGGTVQIGADVTEIQV